jgi:hypothetical protein
MGSLRSMLLTTLAAGALATAWAEDPPATPAKPPSSIAKSPPAALDLAPPDIRTIVPGTDLDSPLPDLDVVEDPPQEVNVKGEQGGPPIPGGFGAMWWGITHPTQVWRIFTPVQ